MDFRKPPIKRVPSLWTIWFPLFLGILLVLALFGLILFSTTNGNTQISMWSQIAIVLLAILLMLIGFLLLFFLLFGMIGIQKLANRMPVWLAKASSFSVVNLARIRRVSTITGNITIFSETLFSQLKSAFKLLESKFIHKK